MSDFDIMGAAASGMQAQRAAMDIDARNVAVAQTGDVRHPAYGLVPQFASTLAAQNGADDGPRADDAASGDISAIETQFATIDGDQSGASGDGVVAFAGVRKSATPVDSISEMINVLDAQRAYEADASVFDIGKRLSERTIEMGRT